MTNHLHHLAAQRASIVIRDRAHFYAIIGWCNKTIGKGSDKWTIIGRVLRYICPTKPHYRSSITREWVCFVPGIDVSPMFLL